MTDSPTQPTNIFDKAADEALVELWTPISRIEKSEDDPDVRIVYGLVSDTSVDMDKQRADGDWLRGALTKWFNEWGNIREMHQPKAVGKAVSLVEEEKDKWFLTSRIVDPDAVRKLDEGVLQGYSINVFWPKLKKDPTAAASLGLICGGDIGETSLVDRPSNSGAKIALMKAAGLEVPTAYPHSTQDSEFGVGNEPRDDEEAAKAVGCDHSDPCTADDCSCSDSKCTKCSDPSSTLEKAGNGRKSPPKGYPEDKSSYASPKDFGWPVDSAGRTRSAMAYYNAGRGRKNHDPAEWASIGRKIVSAANKFFGGGYALTDGKVQKAESAAKAAHFLETRDFTLSHLQKVSGIQESTETLEKALDIPDLLKMDELEDTHLAFMAAEIVRELLVREASEFDPADVLYYHVSRMAEIYDMLMQMAREELTEAFDPQMTAPKMGGVLAALLPPPEEEDMPEDENKVEETKEEEVVEAQKAIPTETPAEILPEPVFDPTPELIKSLQSSNTAMAAELEALKAQLEELGNRAVDNGPIITQVQKAIGDSARLTKLASLKNQAAEKLADATHNPDMLMRATSHVEYSRLRTEISALEKD